jgi:hypothetical protein
VTFSVLLFPKLGAELKQEEASGPAETAARVEATKERAQRVDRVGLLRRTFDLDLLVWRAVWRQAANAGVPDGL